MQRPDLIVRLNARADDLRGAGCLTHQRYSTQIISAIALYFRSLNPSIMIISSGRLNRPWRSRYWIILLAITSPIAGSPINSSAVAMFRLRQSFGLGRGTVVLSIRFGESIEVLLFVAVSAGLQEASATTATVRKSSLMRTASQSNTVKL